MIPNPLPLIGQMFTTEIFGVPIILVMFLLRYWRRILGILANMTGAVK